MLPCGLTLQALARHAEAVVSYRALLRLRPEHLDALNNLGVASYAHGDFAGASRWCDANLAIRPAFSEAAGSRAEALSQMGVSFQGQGQRCEAAQTDHALLAIRAQGQSVRPSLRARSQLSENLTDDAGVY